ncbi:hypothetical protein OAV88_03370, partial [bacterium]|nr:hypothetical protein [bacterium]
MHGSVACKSYGAVFVVVIVVFVIVIVSWLLLHCCCPLLPYFCMPVVVPLIPNPTTTIYGNILSYSCIRCVISPPLVNHQNHHTPHTYPSEPT